MEHTPSKEKDAIEPEVRKLNMEEKRKLEKLLITDIESALQRYNSVISEERKALIKRLEDTPPKEVKALYEGYKLAARQQKEITRKLGSLGYDVRYNGELAVDGNGTMPKPLAEFDDRADKMRDSLAALKRSYVIKLFAEYADTQNLFGSLAKDLERLVG